jgi:hypothetical protein
MTSDPEMKNKQTQAKSAEMNEPFSIPIILFCDRRRGEMRGCHPRSSAAIRPSTRDPPILIRDYQADLRPVAFLDLHINNQNSRHRPAQFARARPSEGFSFDCPGADSSAPAPFNTQFG